MKVNIKGLTDSRDTVNKWMERFGVRFGVYKKGTFKEQLFPFDSVPRIIPKKDWDYLETGLQQRVKAILRFLSKEGIISYKNKSAGYESVVLNEKDLCNVIARRAGIFYRLKNTGMSVTEGEVLARILNPYDSSVLEEVKAPVSGEIFFAPNKPLVLEHAILYRIIREEES